MSALHLGSSFYKQLMDIDNYFKIKEWQDSSIGQSTMIQQLDKKRPKLSNLSQTQNRSLNLNNPELTVCITFRKTSIAPVNQPFLNSIIGNSINRKTAKFVTFYKTRSGLGLLISTVYNGSYVVVANNGSSLIVPDYKFPSSKSNCTILNKWHIISITWSDCKNLSNCWSNGEKLMTFNTGNTKGSDHCLMGDLGTMWGNTHLTGCIWEIIGFYRSLTDTETSHIHKYLMMKWGIKD